MNILPYNRKDKESIILYAKKLEGKTLRQFQKEGLLEDEYVGKGSFGQLLEKIYFSYKPNSDSQPDFPEASLELKSSPLKQLKDDRIVSKERLVLNIINYEKEALKNFYTSSFWLKNSNLLLVLYLHETDKNPLDLVVKLVGEWSFTKQDLEIIQNDWNIIHEKILSGKAHELSEGDTFYLAACTKGANSKTTRVQYKTKTPAKQRAYSLKQGYVNHIIAEFSKNKEKKYGKLIPDTLLTEKVDIEKIVMSKFERYYNNNIDKILEDVGVPLNSSAKNFYANLTKAILEINPDNEIEEFEKANIIIRTVRLKNNNLPKESVSFPVFKYTEIVQEEWNESKIKELIENKFFFIFYKYTPHGLILKKVQFWNMPYNDRESLKQVWLRTKEIIKEGNIVKEVTNGRRITNFPGKSFSPVAHVRPHARNAADTYPLPTRDIVTNQKEYTKHCFWLNDSYIRDNIYLKVNESKGV